MYVNHRINKYAFLFWKHASRDCDCSSLKNVQVNVIALSVCGREAYQSMKERKVDDGHIININGYSNVLFLDIFIATCAMHQAIQYL